MQSTNIITDLSHLPARLGSPIGRPDSPLLPILPLTYTSKPTSLSPKLSPANFPKLSHDSDSEQTVVASDPSLDERIRLLDAKLQHSEKIRPAVDYSKFRIRRKSDLITTTTALSHSQASISISSGMPNEFIVSPLRPCTSPTASDIVSSTTSPLSLRPTDTSEFVKSMLSSTKTSKITTVESIVSSSSNHIISRPPPLSAPAHQSSLPEKSTLLSPIPKSPLFSASPTCGSGVSRRADHHDLKPAPHHLSKNSSTSTHCTSLDASTALSPANPSPGGGLSIRSPKSTARMLQSPGVRVTLKKDNGASTVSSSSKVVSRTKDAQNCIQMKDLFPPQPLQSMQFVRKAKSSPAAEREPILSSPSGTKTLQSNVSVGHKRKVSTSSTVSHLPPKSPKFSTPTRMKLEEDGKLDTSSKPMVNGKHEEGTTFSKTKKVQEAPLIPTKSRKKQPISSPTTPFERNKLHFKKQIEHSETFAATDKTQIVSPSSNNPLKSTKSPSTGPESRSRAKKKRLKRKKHESDEEDWKPQNSIELSERVEEISTNGVLYETMYDKIKRRGNKGIANGRPEAKPEALKSLLKSRKHKVSGSKATDQTQVDSKKNSDHIDMQNENISRRSNKKSSHLNSKSSEHMHSVKSIKRSRLKRPESEGGSSSDSDTHFPLGAASSKRKRTLPMSLKRRMSGDAKSGSAVSAKSKKSAVKRSMIGKLPVIFSSNESNSESDYLFSAKNNPPRAFFPERRRSNSLRSSSTSSTPQISRSCSPAIAQESSNSKNTEDGAIEPDESAIDVLPLLEKQISSDVENEEEVVSQNMEISSSPPLAIPVNEELRQEESIVGKSEDRATETEKVNEQAEVSSIKSDELAVKPRSCGGGLILTSPLVKPAVVPNVVPFKNGESEDFDHSGLALLSSAAEAEVIKHEAENMQKSHPPTSLLSSQLQSPPSQTQPLAVLTPVSVISAPAGGPTNQQQITLVVNTINAATQSQGSVSTVVTPSQTQQAFVLAPSAFSIVAPVAFPTTDNKKQLIINRAPLHENLNADSLVHNGTNNNSLPGVAKSPSAASSANMTEFVQQIIEQVTQQKKEESSQSQEKVKRTKKSVHQRTVTSVPTVRAPASFSLHRPSGSVVAPPASAVDPYEPNFDEPEGVDLLQQRQSAGKDTVSEVINSVVHGEFEQKDYVHHPPNGTPVLSQASSQNSLVPSSEVAMNVVRPVLKPTAQTNLSPRIQELASPQQPAGVSHTSALSSALDVTPTASFADEVRFLPRANHLTSAVVVVSLLCYPISVFLPESYY